jgi:hypothetical protein
LTHLLLSITPWWAKMINIVPVCFKTNSKIKNSKFEHWQKKKNLRSLL